MELSLETGEDVFISLWDPENQQMIYYASNPELLDEEDKNKFYTMNKSGSGDKKSHSQISYNQERL